jgi:hypothetical protein
MAKEFTPQTDVGNIPATEEFQRVKDAPIKGDTGEPSRPDWAGKPYEIAQTVQGIFSNHSEKLFAIIVLIGFTLIFYSGNLKNWCDFWRYTAFLGVFIAFYLILIIAKAIGKKLKL